jgi:hypothetical protein
VAIRDSKGDKATILLFGAASWSTFLECCRSTS